MAVGVVVVVGGGVSAEKSAIDNAAPRPERL